jgi:hypothetical protein
LTAGFKQIELSWTNPTDNDFDLIEIKSNTENNDATASLIASIRSDYYLHRLDANETRFYWLRALDRTGNASDWVYGGTGTTERLLANDFDDDVITIDFLDTPTTNVINSVANYDAEKSEIQNDIGSRALESDFQNVTKNLDNNLTTASERLLRMSLFANEQTQIMRDAGITVDPDNGSVTIQAVEALSTSTSQQFSQVSGTFDAVNAEIELKATRTYVNNQIANAQLDPTDFQAFNDLEIRITDAELDIDANKGAIEAKVDTVTFDGANQRLTTAEGKVSVLEGEILLKATTSEFTALEERVTQAEVVVESVDLASITQTVTDVNRLKQRTDSAEAQDLKQLLEIYDTRQTLQEDISFARTQITADTVATRESIAQQRTELLANINDNNALIISESESRATADQAIATDIVRLRADVTQAESDISANGDVISQLDLIVNDEESGVSALGQRIDDISVSITEKNSTYAQPTAPNENLVDGDLWIDTDDSNKVYRHNGTEFIEIADTRIQQLFSTKAVTYAQSERPTENLTIGDIWIDTDNKNEFYRYDGINFISLSDNRIDDLFELKASTFAQGTAPVETTEIDLFEGDIWIDTSDKNKFYRWDTAQWVALDDVRIEELLTDKTTTFAQDEAPTESETLILAKGDIWIDTNDKNKLYRWNITETESEWVAIDDARIDELFSIKTTTFAQVEAPVESAELDLVEGDVWIDTNDKNKLYRWNTSEWVAVDDARINDLLTGKTTTFAQDDEPVSTDDLVLVAGDLWVDTNANNKLYRYNGGAWVSVGDSRLESFANAYEDLTSFVTNDGQVQAIAEAKTQLATELPENSTFVQDVTQGVSSESKASAKRLEQLVSQQASTQLTEILNREDNQSNLNDEIAIVRSDFNAVTTEDREALVTARTQLQTQIDQNQASILQESIVRADADSSLTSQLNSITGRVADVEGGQFGATNLFDYVEQEIINGTEGIDSRVTAIEGDYATVTVVGDKIDEFDAGFSETGIAGRFEQVDARVTATENGISASARQTDELSSALIEVTGFEPKATYVQPTAPVKNEVGDIWWNDSVLKQYTSEGFVTVDIKSTLEAINVSTIVFVQELEPIGAGQSEGDLWFAIPEIYRYRNGAWSQISQTLLELRAIYASVNVHYGNNEPSLIAVDSLWFDTANDNNPYRWTGTEWVALDIANISETKTTVAQTSETVDGIKGQYSVTINNNGTLSGFGLVSDIINGEPTSAFTVSANQFSLLGSSTGEVWDNTADYVIGDIVTYLGRTYEATDASSNVNPSSNPDEWDDVTETPFEVYTADTVVSKGGEDVTIPKGVYIKDGFIQKASITDANIQSLNADKITAGTINTSRLNIDGVTLDTDATGQLIISDGGVDTGNIADNACTVLTKTTGGSGSVQGVQGANVTGTVATFTVTTTGAPISLFAQVRFSGLSAYSNGIAQIKRDGNFVVSMQSITFDSYQNIVSHTIYDDTVTAGTYEYTIEVDTNSNSGTLYWNQVFFQAMETKR